jgi:hypothetical protein
LYARDGFGTGDTNQTTLSVYVSHTPVIHTTTPWAEQPIVEHLIPLQATATDADQLAMIEAFRDTDPFFDSDGDGVADNDRVVNLNDNLSYRWDLDADVDADEDGNPRNDWIEGRYIDGNWTRVGRVTLILEVCDGLGACTQNGYVMNVKPLQDEEDILGDLNWEDLLPQAGNSGVVIILILLVLLLGWLVMRSPTEIEIDAEEAAQSYDVAEVHTEAGILGMDQHSPPPKPDHLTKDDRRSKESGYVRPVSSRRK